MTVRLDPSAQAHLDVEVERMLDHLGQDILTDARRFVPVVTTRLRESLDSEVNHGILRVGSRDVKYSVYVELGTPPHPIRPKFKKALYWPGADHPVAKVNHPGTEPSPYLRPALFQNRELR